MALEGATRQGRVLVLVGAGEVDPEDHASWLNQIEIWFSIRERRCLRRSDFPNPDVPERGICAFIDTYNRLEARPFKWTYTGDPLAA